MKGLKADISSVSPLSEQLEELWAVCIFMHNKIHEKITQF